MSEIGNDIKEIRGLNWLKNIQFGPFERFIPVKKYP
jgi:hypothetical protein